VTYSLPSKEYLSMRGVRVTIERFPDIIRGSMTTKDGIQHMNTMLRQPLDSAAEARTYEAFLFAAKRTIMRSE
jgi:hypothetical protein